MTMAKKSPEKTLESYKFSQLYYEKKARIQERGCSDFIEFLNWIENVNKWEKKEDWKRLVDQWFNKYSDDVIVWLFNMFVDFKESESRWSSYKDILDRAKSAFKTKIYWENIIRPLFGYYGNYLKDLKRKRTNSDLKKTVETKSEEADKLKKADKQRVAEVLKAEETKKDGINDESEKVPSKRKEPVQLMIQFPEDDWEETTKLEEKEDDDPNMDELYKFDPEVENYWDR